MFTFNLTDTYTYLKIKESIKRYNFYDKTPIIVCIGSDMVLGDSLGPLVGTMLKEKDIGAYIYGTLNYPVTAKEVIYAKNYIKAMHPDSVIIAIDAAIGNPNDIGEIKVLNDSIKPGLGVKKDLGEIGDISIVGTVAEKSENNKSLFNLTRLNLIYKMAENIAEGISSYINEYICVKNIC